MSVSWTKEQEQVITTRNRSILVSAAAGSGKTTVLVERILSMITDEQHPVDIDRLLVVTFTRAAAGEMRDRISRAIEERLLKDPENEHLQRQSILLHHAQISTIHGFCTSVIQNYFYRTDLDPAYRIADDGELKQIKGDVLRELLEEEYSAGNEAFLAFTEMISPGKNDLRLEECIQSVYEFSMASPDPEGWLAACVKACSPVTAEELLQTEWMREIAAEAGRVIGGAKMIAERNLRIPVMPGGPEPYLAMAESDMDQIRMLERCRTYEEYQRSLSELEFIRLASIRKNNTEIDPDLQDQFKTGREELKKLLKNLRESLFADSVDEILAELALIRPHVGELTRLAGIFAQRFSEKKRARSLMDFTDLEHYALKILLQRTEDGWERTDAARELSERYVEIMTDEYQDSNLLQEYLLEAVSGSEEGVHNRFMVGDMKQSIYGFRMARPELFLEKYETYTPVEAGESTHQRITLGMNFRSRPEVLDFVNALFEKLMGADLGGIRYDRDAALYQGASFPEPERPGMNRAELLLLDKKAPEFEDDRSRETMIEAEAMLVAQRIRQLVRENQVCDRASGGMRPVRYGDIAILLRAATSAGAVYARVLQSAGIPAYTASGTGYFSATEIVAVLNYLRILDNPRQDIPFAAVLRAPFCGCTDEELAQIVAAHPDLPFCDSCRAYAEERGDDGSGAGEEHSAGGAGRLRRFFEVYDGLREMLPYTPIHQIILEVLERTGYASFAAAMPAGEQRAANLRMLVEQAVSYEKTSYHGLFRFVRYIEQMESYNVDYGEVNLFGEGENTVRIMTIHKSKGLEFPIVFLSGVGGHFNQSDQRAAFVQHVSFGIGLDAVDLKTRVRKASLLRTAIRTVIKRDQMAEELRVLYVALTRAKEKIIVTGIVNDAEKQLSGLTKTGIAGGLYQPEIPADDGDEKVISYVKRITASGYLDWILHALTGRTPVDVQVVSPSQTGEEDLQSHMISAVRTDMLRAIAGNARKDQNSTVYDPEIHAFLLEKKQYRYPYEKLALLPAKMSVSEIKKRSIEEMMEEKGEEVYPEEQVIPLIPAFIRKQDAAKEPPEGTEEQTAGTKDAEKQFAAEGKTEEISGAERGTVYHKVLAALDLPKTGSEEDLSGQISRMLEKGILSREEAGVIKKEDLLIFASSPVGRRMAEAAARGRLLREQPFVIDIPAKEINPDYGEEEPILVQGVIDAYFEEDGKYVIVDYKTDRVHTADGSDLVEKYRVQLLYYKRALEQILDVRVGEMYLYSVALGRELEVRP